MTVDCLYDCSSLRSYLNSCPSPTILIHSCILHVDTNEMTRISSVYLSLKKFMYSNMINYETI